MRRFSLPLLWRFALRGGLTAFAENDDGTEGDTSAEETTTTTGSITVLNAESGTTYTAYKREYPKVCVNLRTDIR